MAISSVINRFWDAWGTLDKKYLPDGGDSCHRVGMYYALLGMMTEERRVKYPKRSAQDFKVMFLKHHVAPSVFIRHPNLEWDASDWDRMSRDQFFPMIMAASYYDKGELSKITYGHAVRLFLFTNNTRKNGATKKNHGKLAQGEVRNYGWKIPDPTGPEVWATFIRAWGLWFLWPLLNALDIEMLLGSIKWRLKPKHNIAMNHCLGVFYSTHNLPTITSWLSLKIMPPERLIKLIGEHFHDFPNDLIFFEEMFQDAWDSIK